MHVRTRSLGFGLGCFSALLALTFAGCDGGGPSGPGGGSSTTGDSGDGKYHPEPNGTHISETAACAMLVKRQETRLLALSCVGTGQTCPSFLRAQFTTACMEYDKGSVEGCLAYYDQQSSCAAVRASFDNCVITPYPGTEPAGCPPMPDGGSGGSGGTGGATTTGTGGAGGTGTTTGSGGTGGVAPTGGGGAGGVMSGSSSSGL